MCLLTVLHSVLLLTMCKLHIGNLKSNGAVALFQKFTDGNNVGRALRKG